MPAVPPDLIPNIGGIGVLALVLWLIWRTSRQDRATDTTAIKLLQEQRNELTSVRERLAVLEDRERKHTQVLQTHAAWDYRAVTMHPDIGEPPPLYPVGT